MVLDYLIQRAKSNSRTKKGKTMINRQSAQEPFVFMLIREFLTTKADESEESRPIDNKEFYSAMALLTAGVVILALTIGPFALI